MPNTLAKNVSSSPAAVNTLPEMIPIGGTMKPAIISPTPTMKAMIAATHTIIVLCSLFIV